MTSRVSRAARGADHVVHAPVHLDRVRRGLARHRQRGVRARAQPVDVLRDELEGRARGREALAQRRLRELAERVVREYFFQTSSYLRPPFLSTSFPRQ